jgi:hypothetical protein
MRRRDFLRARAMAGGTAALAACGVDEEKPAGTRTTTKVDRKGIDPSLVDSFHLGDPSAFEEPKAHIDPYVPRRQVYNRIWEEVKAA